MTVQAVSLTLARKLSTATKTARDPKCFDSPGSSSWRHNTRKIVDRRVSLSNTAYCRFRRQEAKEVSHFLALESFGNS